MKHGRRCPPRSADLIHIRAMHWPTAFSYRVCSCTTTFELTLERCISYDCGWGAEVWGACLVGAAWRVLGGSGAAHQLRCVMRSSWACWWEGRPLACWSSRCVFIARVCFACACGVWGQVLLLGPVPCHLAWEVTAIVFGGKHVHNISSLIEIAFLWHGW